MASQRTWFVCVCMVLGIILGVGWAVSRRTQRAVRPTTISDRDVAQEMRRRAGEAVEVAAREFARTLDFRPESVEKVEEILGRIHDWHKRTPLSDSDLTRESLRWGAYVGEVIRGVRPCRWALNSKAGGEGSMPVVYADRSESFPVRWCYKRIMNGGEDNVWHKFTILVIERDKPTGLEFAPGGELGPSEKRPSADPAASLPALPEPEAFTKWPVATDRPIPVTPRLWMMCRSPTPEEARVMEAELKHRGPHARYTIVVRTSPEAIGPFRCRQPLQPGATVVKEKHRLASAKGRPDEYALMIKREAGFDPEHGDWEYAYATGSPESRITRGRLVECIDCHAGAKDRDYLFGSYLMSDP